MEQLGNGALMSGRMGVARLRLNLASTLDAAANGSVFLITRSGRDVAVVGPASGSVSELTKAADDCARALREAESTRDAAYAEAARLRTQVADLEEELHNARETTANRKRFR